MPPREQQAPLVWLCATPSRSCRGTKEAGAESQLAKQLLYSGIIVKILGFT
jgi:hypothetical protein